MAQPISVLVVDDEHSVRDGIEALLSLTDDIALVGKAGNGQEALQMVASLQPDVVLMDVCMPVMNGIEAARQTKALYPAIKIIVLTLYFDYADKVLAVGADRVILKGDRSTDLAMIIRQLVSGDGAKLTRLGA